jgi:serine/threonine protein kinase
MSMIGQVVEHFEIQAELGRGGMARVYKAWDRVLNRHVAVKVLNATPGEEPFAPATSDYAQILHEARAASRLDHPNIAPVYQVFTSGARAFLVMQLVDGPTLRERLSEGPMAIDEARRIAVAIARGLAEAHRSGVLHRDIKPENILLTDRGEVKLTDFGIARMSAGNETGAATTMNIRGTPGYLPPEVLNGEAHTARGDVFSAGVTFYELFAGAHPFARATPAATLAAVLTEDAPWLSEARPGFPGPLSSIVMRAMAKDPTARFADAAELLEALESESPVEWVPSPSGTLRPIPREASRGRRLMRGLIPAAVVAIIAAAALLWRGSRSDGTLRVPVAGVVASSAGTPVAGALVTVDGHVFQSRTSSDGRFRGELVDALEGESVLFRVSHEQFETTTHWIELNAARVDSLHIHMVPVE